MREEETDYGFYYLFYSIEEGKVSFYEEYHIFARVILISYG